MRKAGTGLTLWQQGAFGSDIRRHAQSGKSALYQRLGKDEVL